jgi:catechol 2,3-dioxygenase-like lactoylglutathione lyase family enzyme
MAGGSVQLDHTIVHVRDKRQSAAFLAEILGLPAPTAFGPFLAVRLDNDVTLDFMDADADVPILHYAFRVSAAKFDEAFDRVRARNLPYWADPYHTRPGEIDTANGGRRVYFDDPSGHYLEIFTQR